MVTSVSLASTPGRSARSTNHPTSSMKSNAGSPVAGGCNLNRDIPDLLESGGFTVTEMDTAYLPSTPKFAGFNYWGSARRI